ncbi:hypothetical protein [Rhizobium leguminosarum]|uniref:hypothetical protein n=1 Tax=Rhizobium leguminosarum TaxID=384 RepID=UPI0004106FA0|nr:hypothetical protein [Rhizobium leguminosarum]
MANLRKCLLEITDRLGPLADELGLRHRLGTKNDEFYLFFERRDEKGVVWKAPVIFMFPPALTREDIDDTWSDVRIGLSEPVVKPIGTNGWVCFDGHFDDCGEPIGPNAGIRSKEDAFELAETALREFPLVPDDAVYGVIEDLSLADVWDGLRQTCAEHGVEQIDVGRDDKGDEFFRFEHVGCVIEILYTGNVARFLVDGEVQADLQRYGLREIQDEIKWTFDRIDERDFRQPKS